MVWYRTNVLYNGPGVPPLLFGEEDRLRAVTDRDTFREPGFIRDGPGVFRGRVLLSFKCHKIVADVLICVGSRDPKISEIEISMQVGLPLFALKRTHLCLNARLYR